jgi:hypothetical protein
VGSLQTYSKPKEAHLQGFLRSRSLTHLYQSLMKPGRPHYSPRWFKVCNTGKGKACVEVVCPDWMACLPEAVLLKLRNPGGGRRTGRKASFLGNASPRYRAYPLWYQPLLTFEAPNSFNSVFLSSSSSLTISVTAQEVTSQATHTRDGFLPRRHPRLFGPLCLQCSTTALTWANELERKQQISAPSSLQRPGIHLFYCTSIKPSPMRGQSQTPHHAA